MLDHGAALLALRARAAATVIATTGSVTLTATTSGYTRATGSFLTDGIRAGMEVTPAGFGVNAVDVVTYVDATTVTTKNPHAAEAAASGCSLAAYLPELRAYENERFTKDSKRPYLEEEFVPANSELKTLPANGGEQEEKGLYVLKLYGLAGYGAQAIRDSIDAVRARFAIGTPITVGSDTLRIGSPDNSSGGPQAGQILAQGNGWSVCVLRIPWWARTANLIAA